MQYPINLKAGQEERQALRGSVFVLLDLGAAPYVDLSIEIQGFTVETLRKVRKGLRLKAPPGSEFTSVRIEAPVDCRVELYASLADLSINYQDGATVNANINGTVPVAITGQPVQTEIVGQPLQVVNDRGAPAAPVHVVGLTYSDAPATAIIDNAPAAVTHVATPLLAADIARKRARFTNLGPDPVTLGTTGHTWAKRCIVLGEGDTWIESDGANLAWVAITEANGKTASVTAQEVKA